MIDEESKQRIMNELFNEETQQDTTLEDELAGAHNEEHYNQVLLSNGLPAPPLHFHSENEQYYEKGEMVTNDTLDTNLPNQIKTGKMYLINQDGKEELIDTFIHVAPKERSTLWEEYQRLGLPTRAMFYKERFYAEANQMTDEDTKKEWEAQGLKCKVKHLNVLFSL